MTDKNAPVASHLMAGASPRAMSTPASGAFNPMLRGPQVVFAADGEGDGGGGGGLSVEEAIAHLNTHDDEPADAGGAEPAAAAAAEPQSEGATSAPDEAPGAAENQPDGELETGAEPEAVAPAEPPKYWSQDAKARFAELHPDLQAVVLAQEGPREAATAKAKADAEQVRTEAATEMAAIQEFAEQVQPVLAQALKTFRNRWGDNPDWVAFAREHGADHMGVAKAQWESEREQVGRLSQAAAEAEVRAHQVYVRGEFEKLKTLDPELTDPEKGAERRTEVSGYLQKLGIPAPAIQNISATEMTIARKAMLFDQLQAKAAKPTPAPKPAAATTKPLARGAASQGSADPKTKQVQVAGQKFAKTRSIADAVSLLDSMGD